MNCASLPTRAFLSAFLLSALFAAPGAGQQRARKAEKPAPDLTAKYGPHERNVLDLWKAKSERPTPLVIFIHGGGFRAGDKANLSPALLRECLAAGISVVSANYRFSSDAPYPASMLDGARVVQFVRSRAKEWNIDPRRIY